MWPGSWNRRVWPVALPLRKQVALGLCWLFLQPNNSQGSNCQIGNTRTFTASVIPVLGIPAKRQAGPFKAEIVTCSTVLSGADQARFSFSCASRLPALRGHGKD
jgi:hypothetical protein